MNALWTYRLCFFRRHLVMLLVAFGVLVLQSQLVLAAHQCELNLMDDSAMLQHVEHQKIPSSFMKTPLCEKHCVPDSAQKLRITRPLALPVALTLAGVDAPPSQSPMLTGPSNRPP